MRFAFVLVSAALVAGCGDPTCAGQELPELVDDAFEVTLANEDGSILVNFEPALVAELIVREVDGDDVWHITCIAEEDGTIPACIPSGVAIDGDVPEGATLATPETSFSTGPSYEVEVREFDVTCEGETRSGKSEQFTVTIG